MSNYMYPVEEVFEECYLLLLQQQGCTVQDSGDEKVTCFHCMTRLGSVIIKRCEKE
jgi:hypothetical protein